MFHEQVESYFTHLSGFVSIQPHSQFMQVGLKPPASIYLRDFLYWIKLDRGHLKGDPVGDLQVQYKLKRQMQNINLN